MVKDFQTDIGQEYKEAKMLLQLDTFQSHRRTILEWTDMRELNTDIITAPYQSSDRSLGYHGGGYYGRLTSDEDTCFARRASANYEEVRSLGTEEKKTYVGFEDNLYDWLHPQGGTLMRDSWAEALTELQKKVAAEVKLLEEREVEGGSGKKYLLQFLKAIRFYGLYR